VGRLDEIHERLVTWAQWARCAEPGREGTSEGYLRERLDPAHDGEPTPEIQETERAVATMKLARPDYWRYFAGFYLTPPEGRSEYEVSRSTGQPIERVREILLRCRRMVGYNIDRMEALKALQWHEYG